ncbi:MAG: MGDG specific palmitate delta-7 desaturase [Monoraphidium minutum]|nr:MAG: MGDG specific palmitate delta-7 desaturase [Monoraphidium minutum]
MAPAAAGPAAGLSYSEAYERLRGCQDPRTLNTAHPKISPEAQAAAPGAARIWGSDVHATGKGRALRAGGLLNIAGEEERAYGNTYTNKLTTFTWRWAAFGYASFYFCGIVGIHLGYHRLLTHKSFKTYKWVEYAIAFIGTQAGQGDPIEWVSNHRYHHLHCDTPLDPHSPYEGFWWAHIGWLTGTEHSLLDYANAPDLKAQAFYRLQVYTFAPLLFIVKPLVMYWLGGMQAVCWGFAFPLVFGYHATFLVNSASHVWGNRPYETGDLSTNNWWVALLAFGDGWHNAHHAFPYSARMGLEWWQFDPTWYLILALKAVGLAWDLQVPSERAKALKRRCPKAEDVVTSVVTERSPAAGRRKAA